MDDLSSATQPDIDLDFTSPVVGSFFTKHTKSSVFIDCDPACVVSLLAVFGFWVWHMVQMVMFGAWAGGSGALIWKTFKTTFILLNVMLEITSPWTYWQRRYYWWRLMFFVNACWDIFWYLGLVIDDFIQLGVTHDIYNAMHDAVAAKLIMNQTPTIALDVACFVFEILSGEMGKGYMNWGHGYNRWDIKSIHEKHNEQIAAEWERLHGDKGDLPSEADSDVIAKPGHQGKPEEDPIGHEGDFSGLNDGVDYGDEEGSDGEGDEEGDWEYYDEEDDGEEEEETKPDSTPSDDETGDQSEDQPAVSGDDDEDEAESLTEDPQLDEPVFVPVEDVDF